VPSDLAALATAYVLIMAVMGPLAARFVEPIMRVLRRPARRAPLPFRPAG
jgi:CPA2 family monovalent cation:H+ antiporter-2